MSTTMMECGHSDAFTTNGACDLCRAGIAPGEEVIAEKMKAKGQTAVYKSLSVLSGYHMTATERKAVLLVANREDRTAQAFRIGRKEYRLEDGEGPDLYKVRIQETAKDDSGRPFDRVARYTVKLNS